MLQFEIHSLEKVFLSDEQIIAYGFLNNRKICLMEKLVYEIYKL